MKKFVLALFLILSFCINFIIAQDKQWFIKNGNKRIYSSGDYTYGDPYLGEKFLIGLMHAPVYGDHDMFVIYENGDYFNSRYTYTDQFQGENGKTFHLSQMLADNAKFMYFTNLYHGDDDPDGMNFAISCSPPVKHLGEFPINNDNSSLQCNHSVVPGKDITLVIPKGFLNSLNSCNDADTYFYVKYEPTILTSPEVLGPVMATFLTDGWVQINENISNNLFLNFKARIDIPVSRMNTLTYFQIYCGKNENGGIALISSHNEEIGYSHDPNYVEVKCISQKCTKVKIPGWPKPTKIEICNHKIQYHVQFQNESVLGGVGETIVEFTLPSSLSNYPIKFNNWYYGGSQGCYNTNGIEKILNVYPGGIGSGYYKLVFDNSPLYDYLEDGAYAYDGLQQFLIGGENSATIGWFEFCVDFVSLGSNIIHTMDLKLQNPRTYFDAIGPFDIIPFKDPKQCKSDTSSIFKCYRPLKATCPCSCP